MDTHLIYKAALDNVLPRHLLREYIREQEGLLTIDGILLKPESRVHVLALGKAAAALSAEAEVILGGRLASGICITKYEHALPLQSVELIECGHPVPDENSRIAGEKVKEFVNALKQDDTLLVLLSGGASSLLIDVPFPLELSDIVLTNKVLVNSGATIHEINCVRKHLSELKGGQLLRISRHSQVITLAISDVPGDDPETIGSGLTLPDSTTYRDALSVLYKYDLAGKIPQKVMDYLEEGLEGKHPETVKPDEAGYLNYHFTIIATNSVATEAAKAAAQKLGYHILDHTLPAEVNTTDLASALAELLYNYHGNLPACCIWGGETNLQVSGNGKGGRNQHLALCLLEAFSKSWKRKERFSVLCAGTDGTDGPTEAAGAWIDTGLLSREICQPETIAGYLSTFDAYHFFERTGTLLITGPTHTNVMDIVIATIEAA